MEFAGVFFYNFPIFSTLQNLSSFGTGGATVWTKGWRAESVLFSQAQFYTKISLPQKEMISHTIFQISPPVQINAIKILHSPAIKLIQFTKIATAEPKPIILANEAGFEHAIYIYLLH